VTTITTITMTGSRLALRLSGLLAGPVVALVALVQGCSGVVPNDADAKAQAFYDEKLHTEDEKACNAAGSFYDNTSAECLTSVKLASWSCTRSGLEAQLAAAGTTASNASAMGHVDDYLKSGYEMHQCGEDGATVLVVLVRKGRSGDEATLEMERVVFDGRDRPKLQFSYDAHSAGAVGDCQEAKLELWGTGADTAREEVAATETVVVQLTLTPADKVRTYADAECKNEITTASIEAGKSSVLFFYEFTAIGRATLEAQVEGGAYGPAVTSVVEARDWDAGGGPDGGPPSDAESEPSSPEGKPSSPDDGTAAGDAPAPEAASGYLSFAPVSAAAAGTCQPLDILHLAEASETGTETTPAGIDIAISLQLYGLSAPDVVRMYEDAACTSGVTATSLAKGEEQVRVYFKFSAAGSATFTVEGSDGYGTAPAVNLQAN
jgi:hypothetical protein